MTQPAGDVIKVPKVEPVEREPEWRLVQVPAGTPGGHGSWVETDHPAVVDCMGSAPECAENGCQLSTTKAALAACHEERQLALKQRDEARKDAAYHSDCRPNRRQAEAAMADAKATNDKWADEVAARRAAEQQLAALTEERDVYLREFVGWLSADIPELSAVEVPRLAESLERFLARKANESGGG